MNQRVYKRHLINVRVVKSGNSILAVKMYRPYVTYFDVAGKQRVNIGRIKPDCLSTEAAFASAERHIDRRTK